MSIVLCVCKSSLYNNYAKREKPDTGGIFRFNAVSYGCAAAVALISGVGASLSQTTVFAAIAYGLTVFSLQALSIAAMMIGPMSLTALFTLYGMIIPSLAGPIFWHEPFGAGQIAGIVLMLLSLWLLRDTAPSDTAPSDAAPIHAAAKKTNGKWLVMSSVCFVLSGLAGIIEKVHQTSDAKDERVMFIFAAAVVMLLLSLAGCLIAHNIAHSTTRGGYEKREKAVSLKPALIYGAASGLIIGVYFQINLTLAGELDSLIYYPIANGGALLLTVFVSVLAFRERLSKRRLGGFMLGLLSIVVLSLPADLIQF